MCVYKTLKHYLAEWACMLRMIGLRMDGLRLAGAGQHRRAMRRDRRITNYGFPFRTDQFHLVSH